MLKDIGIKNIITVIFVVGAVFAFLVFSGMIKLGSSKNEMKGKITIWGTIPYNSIQPYIDGSKTKNIDVLYHVVDKQSYDRDLVDALAAGNGPDLFIMSHEGILRNADKVFIIPYTSLAKETYLSTYIPESKIFLTSSGILAMPFFVDPLILYYNKQLLSSSYLVGYPKTWDEFSDFASKATHADEFGGISIAGAAMGTFDNIKHAKDIITMLFLQNGNPIVGDDPMSGKKKSIVSASEAYTNAAKDSLAFYTSFQDKENTHYSWNESLRNSQEQFISGDLALYFDRMSQMKKIRDKNPNLDFYVSLVPQLSDTSLKKTYGELYGIAISKHTKQMSAAILIASRLSSGELVKNFTKDMYVAPARNDLLKTIPEDDRLSVAYKSAIIADAWVDPDPKRSDMIFRNIIRGINAKSMNLYEAVRTLNVDIQEILDKTINKVIKGRFDE